MLRTFAFRFALVGGNWGDTSHAGLWCWFFLDASSLSNVNVGARPLILKLGFDVWSPISFVIVALVGGNWADALRCGLWYWNCNNASSNYNATIGARPLILKLGLGVCASYV